MEKGRILVVDDDESFLILVEHLLKSMNLDVIAVSDSTVAYEKIIEFSPDLIISDIQMPALDGNQLLKILKSSKLTHHIPVMFLSAVSLPEKIREGLHEGAEDFLTKPIHPNVFRAKVEKAMERIRHNQMVRNIVSRYLGPSVAQMIMKEPEQVKVYGIRTRIVCLYADIRGFSYIVETMEPEDVVTLLNSVLAELSDAVLSIGGTVDKFLGDGIMAFWGAPLPSNDMEVLAVESALLMMDKLRDLNVQRRWPGGLEIQIGIGISLGNAIVGNIGSEKRTDYTVIGESVNIASRLENLAKPRQILITKELYEKVKDKFICKEIGMRQLKGKTIEIPVFEIIGRNQ